MNNSLYKMQLLKIARDIFESNNALCGQHVSTIGAAFQSALSGKFRDLAITVNDIGLNSNDDTMFKVSMIAIDTSANLVFKALLRVIENHNSADGHTYEAMSELEVEFLDNGAPVENAAYDDFSGVKDSLLEFCRDVQLGDAGNIDFTDTQGVYVLTIDMQIGEDRKTAQIMVESSSEENAQKEGLLAFCLGSLDNGSVEISETGVYDMHGNYHYSVTQCQLVDEADVASLKKYLRLTR